MRLVEIAGDGRVATALAVSRFGFPSGAERVVLASAGGFADALAAAPLAGVLSAPLLLVDDRVTEAIEAELERLGTAEAVIAGAVGAVPALVELQLLDAGYEVRRVAGDGRADTAALIARDVATLRAEAPEQSPPEDSAEEPSPAPEEAVVEVAVTSADDFADALAFAPAAAAFGIPVVLSGRDVLPPDSAAAIQELAPERTLVLGGTEAVSDEAVTGLPSPTRIAGRDRYATGLRAAELLLERGGGLARVGIATGRDFPDGLAAGPALARTRNPLLLIDGQDPEMAEAVYEWLEGHAAEIGEAVVFGGERAVGAAVRDRLRGIGRRARD